jgi:hypothetical protein
MCGSRTYDLARVYHVIVVIGVTTDSASEPFNSMELVCLKYCS